MESASSLPNCYHEPPSPIAPPHTISFLPSHTSFDTSVILVSTLLGICNFAVHLSWLVQFPGLVGQRGISPAIELHQSEKVGTRVQGLFRKGRVAPTNKNIRRVLLVGILVGFLQTFGGLVQLLFGCRSPSPFERNTSSICNTNFIKLVVLGDFKASDSNLVFYFFSTFFAPWFCSLVALTTYYSVREVAGRFMGLQMHAKVLELNFWYAVLSFCGNSFATALAFQFFAVRLMVGGGLGKLTGGDASWKAEGGYAAMCYHYWTMPLPNPLSRFFHHLPVKIHRLEVMFSIFVEGPLGIFSLFQPFLNNYAFGAHLLRLCAFLGNFALLLGINVSGNFGHLWLLSIAAAAASLDDAHLSFIFPTPAYFAIELNSDTTIFSTTQLVSYFITLRWCAGILVSISYCLLQLIPFAETYRSELPPPFHHPVEKILLRLLLDNKFSASIRSTSVWKQLWEQIELYAEILSKHSLLNMYVKFANMTKFRHEIIIQAKPKETGSQWVEIPFKYKPYHEDVKPKFAPLLHLPSLDWFCWFIPLSLARGGGGGLSTIPPWFITFLEKIRDQEPCVLDLLDREALRKLPFSKENPPACVRVMVYEFVYSTVKGEGSADEWTGIPNSEEVGIAGKKMTGFYQRVGKPKQGKWWRKTQIGHQSVVEV